MTEFSLLKISNICSVVIFGCIDVPTLTATLSASKAGSGWISINLILSLDWLEDSYLKAT
jgi:hypothetical protein